MTEANDHVDRCRYCERIAVRHITPRRQCLFASTHYEPMTLNEYFAYLTRVIGAGTTMSFAEHQQILNNYFDRGDCA